MRRSASSLLKDFARLADLQIQLLGVDLYDFWQQARLGIVATLGAVTLALSALTVLLFGLADFIQTAAGWSEALSHVVTGGCALLIGGLGLLLGLRQLTTAAGALQRSRQELQENLEWLRSILTPEDESET